MEVEIWFSLWLRFGVFSLLDFEQLKSFVLTSRILPKSAMPEGLKLWPRRATSERLRFLGGGEGGCCCDPEVDAAAATDLRFRLAGAAAAPDEEEAGAFPAAEGPILLRSRGDDIEGGHMYGESEREREIRKKTEKLFLLLRKNSFFMNFANGEKTASEKSSNRL